MNAADYVLARFSREQEAEMPFLLDTICAASELVLREGVAAAMNRYNAEGRA
jgi:PTH1 family peptidyl-tRNA hydrolase